METIPRDVLVDILDYLDFEDHISCMNVCKYWKELYYAGVPELFSDTTSSSIRDQIEKHLDSNPRLSEEEVQIGISDLENGSEDVETPEKRRLSRLMILQIIRIIISGVLEVSIKRLESKVVTQRRIRIWKGALDSVSLDSK
jgi:hypothetical protein